MGDRDRRGGVEGVVAPRHRQSQIVDIGRAAGRALANEHGEAGDAGAGLDVEQADVGLRVLAIGEDPPVLDLADQLLHRRMVEAHHGEAVERQVLDEGQKGVLDRVEGLEMVEVLGVDVGDDRHVRRQLEEGAVALVGLDHHPVAAAEPGVGAVGVDDAAVDHGRVEPGRLEQRRHQRGGGRLAVGAGDRDACLSRISSASISARRTTGMRFARAARARGCRA